MEEEKVRYRYHRAWPLLLFSLLCYFMTGTVSSIMNVSVGIMEAERGWNATLSLRHRFPLRRWSTLLRDLWPVA